ncbi:hypothetical protein EVA_05433 [gut metagenome]|uniref:Uncharacterized protein n=1 Tax=gut metagenome TaxID=749906 RepID=J9GGE7_9ZZZZ
MSARHSVVICMIIPSAMRLKIFFLPIMNGRLSALWEDTTS